MGPICFRTPFFSVRFYNYNCGEDWAKMNKKALLEKLLVTILAFALVAWVVITFGSQLASQLKEDTDIETCRLSVLAQAQTRKIPGVGISTPGTIVPLDCPRRNLKIFKDNVEINGKKSKKYKFKKLTSDEMNRIAAEELRLCWYKMAEGNKNIFEQSYLIEFKTNTCLICSQIEFDEDIQNGPFEGLVDYLKSNKIPKRDVSYFDYLVKPQSDTYLFYLPWTQWNPWFYGTSNKVTESSFNPRNKYVVYFLAFKPAWLPETLLAVTSAYYIGLGKEDKLNEECQILVN